VIYLSPISDRRRTGKGWIMPIGWSRCASIDMRPGGTGEGYAVLERLEPFHHHQVRPVCATADERLSRRAIRHLGNALGVTLKRSRTVAEAVLETWLLQKGRLPLTPGGEREVFLSRRLVHRRTVIRHRDAVRLGDWLYCAFGCHLWWPEREVWLPAIAGGTSFTESWPTSGQPINGVSQDLVWTVDYGVFNSVNAGSPNFVDTNNAPAGARAAANGVTVNHKATGTAVTANTGVAEITIWARCTYPGSGNTFNGFCVLCDRAGPDADLFRDAVALDTDTTVPGATAYSLFVQCSGTTITGDVNGVALGPATDSNHGSDTIGGFKIRDGGTPANVHMQAWSIEDVAAAAVTVGHALVNRWRGDEMTHPPVPVGGGTY
jgi:hypothetical protein